MGILTKIEWCDHTFNPWRGCSKVSPGCSHCYAEKGSLRNPRVLGVWGANGTRVVASENAESGWGAPVKWDRQAAADGVRRRVFCASLADWLEDWRGPILTASGDPYTFRFPGESMSIQAEMSDVRLRLLDLIARTPNLDYLLLTKRPEGWRDRMAEVLKVDTFGMTLERGHRMAQDWLNGEPPPNVWVGTSAEDQERWDERRPHLFAIPARVRFVSYEPALGPVNFGLGRYALPKHRESWPVERNNALWIIVGGESGHNARPFDIAWARWTVEQCRAAGVPVFVKQMGSMPVADSAAVVFRDPKGGNPDEWPEELRVREFPDQQPKFVSYEPVLGPIA